MIEEVPKNPNAKRRWQERQPKVNENAKRAMFIKGHKASAVVTLALQELAALKAPFSVKYNNKKKK
jgi:ribosome production factor 2